MKYTELKAKHRAEVEAFPMQFAFSTGQLRDGLEKLGIDPDDYKDKVVSIGAGGFIRKDDAESYVEMIVRQSQEMDAAMHEDNFLIDAIEYELGNHEYCVTGDPYDATSVLGISLEDERVKRCFRVARDSYLASCKEYC